MVVQDNDIDAALLKFSNFTDRSSAAINGDQQLWTILLEAAFDAFAAQPVALLHPQRQKKLRGCAVTAQHFREQRQGSHAIDIVVSKQHDAFARIQRSQNPGDCCAHLREQKWIAQRAKTRPQERLNVVWALKAFPGKQSRYAF